MVRYDKWGRPIRERYIEAREPKIRNPIKYLSKKYGVPKQYAEQYLKHAGLHRYWKKDNSGSYVNKETLDAIGYGWKHEGKDFMEAVKPPISPYMKKQYKKDLFPSFKIPSDMKEDPMFRRWIQRFEETKQYLEESGANKETRMKAIKKLRKEFTKDLIKRYPKDKTKIEQSAKQMEKDFALRMRLNELLEIGSKRPYTYKESEELEKLTKHMKN